MPTKFILPSLLGLMAWYSTQAAFALGIQINDPVSGQNWASESVTANIQLGGLNAWGLRHEDMPPQIDAIYALLDNNLLANPQYLNRPAPAIMYILGSHPNQAAMTIQATDLGEQTATATLIATYRGDLPLYLSDSKTDWQPNSTIINGSQHILIPNDGSEVILAGSGGYLRDEGLSEGEILGIDMAFKVALSEPPGPKSATLTFTLIPE
jgi:hypothetical protein